MPRLLSLLAAASAALLVAGCSGGAPEGRAAPSELPFTDVAAAAGLAEFRIQGSRGDQTSLLDTVGYGAGVLDYDGDNLPDLVLTGPDRVQLYRNRGEFRFEPVEAGLRQEGRWGGAAVADVDNNGWPDLYLTGYGCAALYLNRDGKFQEVTAAAGLQPPGGKYPAWGSSAGFADLDADGWADLVVCYYLDFGPDLPQRCKTMRDGVTTVCPPKVYQPQYPRVYRNLRGKRFQDVSAAWGVRGHGGSLGVAFQDADGDGRLDFAVANDERPGDFYRNLGGKFAEIGAESGTAYDREGRVHGGMGIDWSDVDGDRLPDLTVMTFTGEDKNLYRNLGGLLFEDVGWRWGLTGPMRTDIAFGARFLDYDNDGRPDLLVANGHIQENAERIRPETRYHQPLRLFRNTGGAFTEVSPGAWPRLVGRALATADFDNDGGMDAVVTNLEGSPLLLRNTARRGHWLGLELEGRRSNRMALGARVEVELGGAVRVFEVHTAGSYMAASDARLLVGLGESASVQAVTIRWPAGGRTRLAAPAADRWIRVHEEE